MFQLLQPGHKLSVRVKSVYNKTCLKRPIKIDKTKILMTNGSLMKVESIQNAPLGAFCNTCDLH